MARQYPISGKAGSIVNGTDLAIEFFVPNQAVTWFWTISDCDLREGQYLQMKARMTWTNPGSWWYHQFSVEDQDLLTIYFIYVILWMVLAMTTLVCLQVFFVSQNRELDWVSTLVNPKWALLTQEGQNLHLYLFSVSFG